MDRRAELILVGETLREIGILAVTFIPLEASFSDRAIHPYVLIGLVIGGVVLIGCGILLEIRHR
jgi:hypothetical protein